MATASTQTAEAPEQTPRTPVFAYVTCLTPPESPHVHSLTIT